MMSEEFSIFRPRHHLPASSATEPLPPDIADYPRELPEASGVGRSSVILVVAPEHGIEGLLLCVHRFMAVLPAPFGHGRQTPSEPLIHRRTFTVNFPLRLRAQMCVKPRKSNVAGFFPSRFACSAYRPKSTSRVFSGWSVRPYFLNRFGKTSSPFRHPPDAESTARHHRRNVSHALPTSSEASLRPRTIHRARSAGKCW
jgi:hypothetical protein